MAALKNDFEQQRNLMLREESDRYLGSGIVLTEKESQVNEILMKAKNDEIRSGFANPNQFIPAMHMFDALSAIEASKVFKILRKMPKGGILHSHDTALLSIDKIIKFTYKEHLWIAGDVFKQLPQLMFSQEKPTQNGTDPWLPLKEVRAKHGTVEFDTALRRHFTLYCKKPCCTYRDIDEAWNKFMSLFAAIDPIILYDEIWMEYFYQALEEMLEDGVQYLEFRGLLPQVGFLILKKIINQPLKLKFLIEILFTIFPKNFKI